MHQRTFHEVYRMAMPVFVPDALGLYRVQRSSNWGYSSYGVHEAQGSASRPEPWWNSFRAMPDVVVYHQQNADWEQLPHVQRFASVPGLLHKLQTTDLADVSNCMAHFHD